MKNALPGLTAVLLLACLALGYLIIRQKTEITEISLNWDAAGKDAQKRIHELQHQLASAKEAQALAEKQAAQAAAEAAPAAQAKGAPANRGTNIIHISDILKEHPEYAGIYAKQMRRNIDRMYGSGLATLNLTPDQESQLKGLLAERQMGSIDAMQAAEAAGLERDSPEWRAAMKQAGQDVQQQINSILGPNADATLAQLQARAGIQNQVEYNYSADFADAGSPLTAEQSSGLVQAMADANYAGKDLSTRPANYNDPDPTTGLTPHDNRIIQAAAQVLSPAQLEILKTDQAENSKIAAIMKEYSKGGGQNVFVP